MVTSAKEASTLADRLVQHLKASIRNTYGQDWTQRNLALLRGFSRSLGAVSFPSAPDVGPQERTKQFLWDFIAYQPNAGVLLAVETEHNESDEEILYDFEKLLYVRSQVKLMMCRIDDGNTASERAEGIRTLAEAFMRDTCAWYTPGDPYCVWWSDETGENRDFAFRLQVNGELEYRDIDTEKFEPV